MKNWCPFLSQQKMGDGGNPRKEAGIKSDPAAILQANSWSCPFGWTPPGLARIQRARIIELAKSRQQPHAASTGGLLPLR